MQEKICQLYHFKGSVPEDIPLEIQELFKPLERQKTFYASRLPLREALKTWGISVNSWEELEIERGHHLKLFPKILVSLSHTRNFGAAFIASQNSCQSLGVDIELAHRKMSEGALKFFINSDDEFLSPLVLWTQKEAAFKALSPLFPDVELVLKMITVKNDQFFFGDKKGIVSSEKIVCDGEELWLAKAIL